MVTIDQARIEGFPRSQQWWRGFLPEWIAVTIAGDGIVTLTHSGLTMRYTDQQGVWWEPHPDQSAAARRRREQSVAKWIAGLPRLAAAIVDGEPS